MSKQLTIKQEKFVLKYFECGNGAESYRYAYSTEKMKPNTIKRKANELLKNGNITATLNELRDKAKEESVWTVEKLIQVHSDIIELGLGLKSGVRTVIEGIGKGFTQAVEVETKDMNLPSAKASAVEIGKLQGYYTAKVEVSGDIDLGDIAKTIFQKKLKQISND